MYLGWGRTREPEQLSQHSAACWSAVLSKAVAASSITLNSSHWWAVTELLQLVVRIATYLVHTDQKFPVTVTGNCEQCDTEWHGEQGLGHIGLSGSASIPGPALPSPVTAGGMGGCWRKSHAGCFWRAFPPSLSVKHREFVRFFHTQGDPQTFLEDRNTSLKGFCCWPHQAFIKPSFFARWVCISQWEWSQVCGAGVFLVILTLLLSEQFILRDSRYSKEFCFLNRTVVDSGRHMCELSLCHYRVKRTF